MTSECCSVRTHVHVYTCTCGDSCDVHVLYMYNVRVHVYIHVHAYMCVQAVLGVSSRGLPGSWKSHVCTKGIFKSRRGILHVHVHVHNIIAHAHMVF